MSWKDHIVHILPKLNSTSYALRCRFNFSNFETTKLFCYAYFHSIMKYGITFFSNSTDIKGVLQLQKKTMRIMMRVHSISSFRPIFKALKILKVAAQYGLSLMAYPARNLEHFIFNNSIHSVCTSGRLQLQRPATYIASCQKGMYHQSITIYNILPKCIGDLVEVRKQLLQSLRSFEIKQSFYLIDEFSDYCVTQVL